MKRQRFTKLMSVMLAFLMVITIIPSNVSMADTTEAGTTEVSTGQAKTDEQIPEVNEESEKPLDSEFIKKDAPEVKEKETTEAETEESKETVSEEVTTEAETSETVTTEVTSEATTVESTEAVSEETTEKPSEATTEKSTEAEKKDDDKKKSDKAVDDKKDDKEKKKDEEVKPTFDHLYDGVSVAGLDFSSCELLIATSDSSIFTADTDVVSEYKGIYLTRYKNSEQTKSAYTYYYNKCQFIDVNSKVRVNGIMRESRTPSFNKKATATDADDDSDADSDIPNDGHGEADLSDLNDGNDALSNLNDTSIGNYSGCIALIDTGASGSNVIGSVSVLGGGAGDDNGHGTSLAGSIASANPNAKILSIKALGSDGTGKVSDVYAGIEYAIKANVSVINLSMCSVVSADSDSLEKAIAQAQSKGIKVVASAGNNGSSASFYTPANISGVLTIGACDGSGKKTDSSNYGSSVDYYVVASSTSEAAAKFSAYLIKDGFDKVADRDDVFTREEVENYKDEETGTKTDAEEDIELEVAFSHATWTNSYDDWFGDDKTDAPHVIARNVTLKGTTIANLSVSMGDYDKDSGYGNLTDWETCKHLSGSEWSNTTASSATYINRGYLYEAYKRGGLSYDANSAFDFGTAKHTDWYGWSCVNHQNEAPSVDGTARLQFIKLKEKKVGDYWYAWYGGIWESISSIQSVGLMFSIRKKVEKSYIPIKKVMCDADGNVVASYSTKNIPEIWFAVYSDKNYKKLIGYMHTSYTSGNGFAQKLRDEKGTTVNEDGDTGKSLGSTVYIKELGQRNVSGKAEDDNHKLPSSFKNPVINGITYKGKNKKLGAFTTTKHAASGVDNAASYLTAKNYSGSSLYIAVKKYDEKTGAAITTDDAIFQFVGYADNGNAIILPMQYYNLSEITYFNNNYSCNSGTVQMLVATTYKDGVTGNFDRVYNYNDAGTAISNTNHGYDGVNHVFYSSIGFWYDQGYTSWYAYEVQKPKGYRATKTTYSTDLLSYYVDDPIELTIREGSYSPGVTADTAVDPVTNKPEDRYITIYKHDKDGQPVPGIHFSILNVEQLSPASPRLNLAPDETGGYTDASGKLTFKFSDVYVGGKWNVTFIEDGYDASNATAKAIYDYVEYDANGNEVYPNHEQTVTGLVDSTGDNGEVSVTATNKHTTPVTVVKTLSDTKYKDNPNYSLEGITIKLYKDSKRTAFIGEMVLDKDGKVVKTKKAGQNVYVNNNYLELEEYDNAFDTNAAGQRVATKFYYEEIIPDDRKDVFEAHEFGDNDYITVNPKSSVMNYIRITNTPVLDPIDIELIKLDREGNPSTQLGNTTLEGAQFTIKFYPQDVTKDFDSSKDPERTWIFQTKKVEDEYKIGLGDPNFADYKVSGDEFYDSNSFKVPRGYVTIQETKAPDGYLISNNITVDDENGQKIADSDNNGIVVIRSDVSGNATTGNQLINAKVEEDKVRADIDFRKVDENGEPMANVSFELKEMTSGQTVICVTDEEGYFSTASSYVKHSVNTNQGKAKCGTWFPTDTTPDDAVGALIVATYQLRELRCKANEGKQLETAITFDIKNEDAGKVKTIHDVDATDPQNKIWNMVYPDITTQLFNPSLNAQMLVGYGSDLDWTDQTVEDTVKYNKLRENTDYTLKCELMVVEKDNTGKVLSVKPFTEGGNPYIRVKSFKTEAGHTKSKFEKSGEVKILCEHIDPSILGDDPKKPNHLVAFETLYLGKYDTLADLDAAIADGSMKYAYDEFVDEDVMDFFPVTHTDETDIKQTVPMPIMGTKATDNVTNDNISFAGGTVTITDTISYRGLEIGKEYTATGTLHIKNEDGTDGGEYKDADGNPVTGTKTFTAEAEDGIVEVEFTVDASLLAGKVVVAFEEIYKDNIKVCIHADIQDAGQTVSFPTFKTTTWSMDAPKKDDGTLEHNDELTKEIAAAKSGVSFTDTINYTNLLGNRTYMVVGKLMDKVTGEPLKDAGGKEITATGYFKTPEIKPEEVTSNPFSDKWVLNDGTVLRLYSDHADYIVKEGSYDLKFEGYDFSNLGNVTGVVFEELYLVDDEKSTDKSKPVGEHKDIDDVDQFLYFVEVHTNATDKTTGIPVVPQDVDTVVSDLVSYKNLIPGKKYKLKATLHVKNDFSGKYKDGDSLLGADNKPIEVEHEFTPATADGEELVEIPFNTSTLRHMEIVVFEDMYNEYGMLIGLHADIDDNDQTLEVPDGKTTALGKDTGEHLVGANETVTIVDTVTYYNLVPGTEYTLKGVLMDKETNQPLLVNGAEVTNTTTFKPTTKDGTTTIEFTFDASALKGKTIVVFEDVLYNNKPVFVHHDIQDKEQSVVIPDGHTTAIDKDTEDHVMQVGDEVTIIDTVYYEGLIPGKEYEITGTLYSKKFKSPIKSGDDEVTSTRTFIPETESGTVDVEFVVGTEALQGSTLVVFEDVYYTNPAIGVKVLVFSHHDIDDADQTLYIPKIGTKALIDGKKNVVTNGKVTITDAVKYKNLVPDKKYTIEGTLMNKKTKKEILIDGKPVTAKKTFTPEEADGEVDVKFTFDAATVDGDIVVFETLYYADVEVADHSDIDDKSQTVTIENPTPPARISPPKTGMMVFFIIIGLMAAGAAGMFISRKKKSNL